MNHSKKFCIGAAFVFFFNSFANSEPLPIAVAPYDSPYWIAIEDDYYPLHSPYVDLSSVTIDSHSPNLRHINFVEHDLALPLRSDIQDQVIELSVDCEQKQLITPLQMEQKGSSLHRVTASEIQKGNEQIKYFSQVIVKLACGIQVPFTEPEWVDINKAINDNFPATFRGPFSSYDRNSIFIAPDAQPFALVTLKDHTISEGKQNYTTVYRYLFDCRDNKAVITMRFFLEKSYDVALEHGYANDTEYLYKGLITSGNISMPFIDTEIDEYSSPQMQYVFKEVCSHLAPTK